MIKETGFTAVISGSLSKFYPEIMRTIEEFRDLGVDVLAPPFNSWLYVPRQRILTPQDISFRPLKGEQHMTVRQVEDSFLASLARAQIHYVDNHNGYIGNSTGMELGFAVAYASVSNYPFITSRVSLSLNPELRTMFPDVIGQIETLTPTQAVAKLHDERHV